MQNELLVGILIHIVDEMAARGILEKKVADDFTKQAANAWYGHEEDLGTIYEHFKTEAQSISSEDPDANAKFLRAIIHKPDFNK